MYKVSLALISKVNMVSKLCIDELGITLMKEVICGWKLSSHA